MSSLEDLQRQIDEIQKRNLRVEADKAWETSWTRKLILLMLTYTVVVIVFLSTDLPDPLLNAIVPSVAFVISTLTVPLCKQWWLRCCTHNNRR
jgi:hypothetical protein